MEAIGEKSSLPQFLTAINASTTLLSYHFSMGRAARARDLLNGASITTGLSTLNSPVPPLVVRGSAAPAPPFSSLRSALFLCALCGGGAETMPEEPRRMAVVCPPCW